MNQGIAYFLFNSSSSCIQIIHTQLTHICTYSYLIYKIKSNTHPCTYELHCVAYLCSHGFTFIYYNINHRSFTLLNNLCPPSFHLSLFLFPFLKEKSIINEGRDSFKKKEKKGKKGDENPNRANHCFSNKLFSLFVNPSEGNLSQTPTTKSTAKL